MGVFGILFLEQKTELDPTQSFWWLDPIFGTLFLTENWTGSNNLISIIGSYDSTEALAYSQCLLAKSVCWNFIQHHNVFCYI